MFLSIFVSAKAIDLQPISVSNLIEQRTLPNNGIYNGSCGGIAQDSNNVYVLDSGSPSSIPRVIDVFPKYDLSSFSRITLNKNWISPRGLAYDGNFYLEETNGATFTDKGIKKYNNVGEYIGEVLDTNTKNYGLDSNGENYFIWKPSYINNLNYLFVYDLNWNNIANYTLDNSQNPQGIIDYYGISNVGSDFYTITHPSYPNSNYAIKKIIPLCQELQIIDSYSLNFYPSNQVFPRNHLSCDSTSCYVCTGNTLYHVTTDIVLR